MSSRADYILPGTFRRGPFGMTFAYIPPGTFLMGSPRREDRRVGNERQILVRLTRGFEMQTTPVTQSQWHAVMGTRPSRFNRAGRRCPVESISWFDVESFIAALNQLEGEGRYRLPCAAEWEYACRAGNNLRFHGGPSDASLPFYGWFGGNAGGRTHPVGRKPPNHWGLHDMHGNVWEWCQDWFGTYPYRSQLVNPQGPDIGFTRVVRGGSMRSPAWACRSACHRGAHPKLRQPDVGFRLVRKVEPTSSKGSLLIIECPGGDTFSDWVQTGAGGNSEIVYRCCRKGSQWSFLLSGDYVYKCCEKVATSEPDVIRGLLEGKFLRIPRRHFHPEIISSLLKHLNQAEGPLKDALSSLALAVSARNNPS